MNTDDRKGIMLRATPAEWKQIKRAALESGMTLQDFGLSALKDKARAAEAPAATLDVAAIRRRLGLTQGELAHRMGVDRSLVSHWESGIRKPSGPAVRLLTLLAEERDAA